MGSSAFLRLLLSIGLLIFLVVLELPSALDLGLGLPPPSLSFPHQLQQLTMDEVPAEQR